MTGVRTTLVAIIILCVSCCSVTGQIHSPAPTNSFVKVLRQITVKCKKVSDIDDKSGACPDGLTLTSSASGISVFVTKKENIVFTAGHVCQIAIPVKSKEVSKLIEDLEYSIIVIDYNGITHSAKTIAFSLEDAEKGLADLCSLQVDTLSVPKIKLAPKAPIVGENLTVMSSPYGIYHPPVVPIFKGIFSGDVNNVRSIITVPAAGGSSGSGGLNQKNQLVGILYAVNRAFPNISLMTTYRKTKEFLSITKKRLKSTSKKKKKS